MYVDYYLRDNFVIHLLPDQPSEPVRLDAGETMALGEQGEWIVSPPFGQEMIALIAAPFPLSAVNRQVRESDADYLAALHERLKADSAGTAGRPVTADFVFITTKPRDD